MQLAAQLGYLRLSGYRLALEQAGLRSKAALVNPPRAVVAMIPDKAPGRLFGGARAQPGGGVCVTLPPAGARPTSEPEQLRQEPLALALRDESHGGAEAGEPADHALELAKRSGGLIRRQRSRRPNRIARSERTQS